MDYTNLLNDRSGRVSRVGVVGATKGYGYTLLAQIPTVAHMKLRVICSRHTDECLEVLKEIGYDEGSRCAIAWRISRQHLRMPFLLWMITVW